jgi:alkylated DNA repair dioxygenase AlkB
LIEELDQLSWCTDLARRTQHFGYKYSYKYRKIDKTMKCDPLPQSLVDIANKLEQLDEKLFAKDGSNDNENDDIDIEQAKPLFEKTIDQCIVNEYQPGQGIGAHVDCTPCFANTIASLSLASGAAMVLRNCKQRQLGAIELWLPRRSLVLLRGAARYEWTHAIPSRRVDPGHGARSRRVSLTFRSVLLDE